MPGNPRKVTDNVENNQNIKHELYSAKIIWQTGAVDIQSLTAYQTTDVEIAVDLDGTNVNFSSNVPSSDSHAVSQEFRLGSRGEQRLNWVTGVYYLYEDASQALTSEWQGSAGLRYSYDESKLDLEQTFVFTIQSIYGRTKPASRLHFRVNSCALMPRCSTMITKIYSC